MDELDKILGSAGVEEEDEMSDMDMDMGMEDEEDEEGAAQAKEEISITIAETLDIEPDKAMAVVDAIQRLIMLS